MHSARTRKAVSAFATFEKMETRRLFSGTGHHDLVDVDGPNHEANDNGAINMEPVHNHRGKGSASPATKHNDAVDNDANDVDGPNHEANDNGAGEAVHNHRGQGNGGPATKHNDAVDND